MSALTLLILEITSSLGQVVWKSVKRAPQKQASKAIAED